MAERTALAIAYCFGIQYGFYSGDKNRTVTQIIKEDMQILKPTIFIAVPWILEWLEEVIRQKFDNSGFMKPLINYAVKTKLYYLKRGFYTHDFFDKIIFGQIPEQIGGNVRIIFTGAAPINPNTLDFLKICFSVPIVECYGQSESSGPCFNTFPKDSNSSGHVGSPLSVSEYRLEDVAEMNYLSKNN